MKQKNTKVLLETRAGSRVSPSPPGPTPPPGVPLCFSFLPTHQHVPQACASPPACKPTHHLPFTDSVGMCVQVGVPLPWPLEVLSPLCTISMPFLGGTRQHIQPGAQVALEECL